MNGVIMIETVRHLFRYMAVGNMLQFGGIILFLDNINLFESPDPISGLDHVGIILLILDWLICSYVIQS